jgi:FKBP-type peptidyl-prolyl cis-trans isomerase FkpA
LLLCHNLGFSLERPWWRGIAEVAVRRVLGSIVLATVGLTGCGEETPTNPTPGVTELQIMDLVVGTGAAAVNGATLTADYSGWLYDEGAADSKGAQFDSSIGRQPFSFVLGAGSVIQGWDQGLVGMRVGGQRRLVIPPSLAYGSQGQGPIPPNASLVFDVDLLAVN